MRSPAWDGDFDISQVFGETRYFDYSIYGYDGHNGGDIATLLGTKHRAPDDGWVSSLWDTSAYGGYGLYSVLTTDTGAQWLWGHQRAAIAIGGTQRVSYGDEIGETGNTGNSSAKHLHLSHWPAKPDKANGFKGAIDPIPVLRQIELARAILPTNPTPEELEATMSALKDLPAEKVNQIGTYLFGAAATFNGETAIGKLYGDTLRLGEYPGEPVEAEWTNLDDAGSAGVAVQRFVKDGNTRLAIWTPETGADWAK